MDSETHYSIPFWTQFIAKFSNDGVHYYTYRPMQPSLGESTVEPFQRRITVKPGHENDRIATRFNSRHEHSFGDRPTGIYPRPIWQFHTETTLTPVRERPTATPNYKKILPVTTPRDTPLQNNPTMGPATTIHVHSSGLEKCLWVALGGIGVVILMAFFMKLGKPIRRVRRHLTNTRTSPVNPDGNLGMGSHDRLVNMNEPGPGYNDPPPPYIECITQCDIDEPPPRYSASYEDYENAVHIRQQKHNAPNAANGNGVRVEFITKTLTCNVSDDIVKGKRTELVFDNGRIVERLSLYQNGNNIETGAASNDNAEEQSDLLYKSRV